MKPENFDPKKWTLRDLAEHAKTNGVRGRVATGKGLIHHTEASRGPDGKFRKFAAPSQEQMKAELSQGLPPVIRREARARYQVLIKRLFEDGQKTQQIFGYPVWPKSIQDELRALGWQFGNPDLQGQVEALARKYIEEGARKQKEKDEKKVALDWHGHLSA